MESNQGGKTMMNPRASIDNQLELIQKNLNGVEERLAVILEELLGLRPIPVGLRPVPEDRARVAEKTKTMGWFNQVVLRLDKFRNQLRRISELEDDLQKSIIGSPTRVSEV